MYPRWHTFSPGRRPEETARSHIAAHIEEWWNSFAARHEDIAALFSGKQNWNLPEWMHSNLQAISPDLMWEFGPGLEVGHRLVVTPEHRHDLRPLVDELLERAPALEGWSFFGHRLRESLEVAMSTVEARTGAPLLATGFKCEKGRFNLVDISVEFPGSTLRKDRDLAFSQTFVLLESVLGEAVLNAWVGAIDVKVKGWTSRGVERLSAEVDGVIAAITDALPRTPIHAANDDAMWTLLKMEPKQANDYVAQSDIFVGKAMNTDLWQNAHTGVAFHSQRYSRCGEVFCFLKMDGSEGLTGETFEDKGDIEDALDERLRAEQLGCFVGGGTGLRYSYVDLAIVDVNKAVPVIRDVLQAGNLTRRSWIQFYDSEWKYEWVGIWNDSPPPPIDFTEAQ